MQSKEIGKSKLFEREGGGEDVSKTLENRVLTLLSPFVVLGCVPLAGSGTGFLIQDLSDHGVPKERNFGS